MTKDLFIGAIARPNATIAALLKDGKYSVDWRPGISATVVVQLALSLALAAIAWAALLALVSLAGLLGGNLGPASGALTRFFAAHLSPFLVAIEFVKMLAMNIIGGILFALLLNYLFKRLFKHEGENSKRLYNVIVLVTLPFLVFAIIPVLGALVMFVGVFLNCFRVISAAYAEKEPVRVISAMLLSGVGTMLCMIIVAWTLSFALKPLLAADFTGAWIDSMSKKAIYGESK